MSAAEDAHNMAQNLMDNLRRSQLPYGYDPQPLLTVSARECVFEVHQNTRLSLSRARSRSLARSLSFNNNC